MSTPPNEVTALGNLMRVDAVTAEVVTKARARGIRTILLKGASFGQWIYDRRIDRLYADTDLLVAPDQADALRAVMKELGFEIAVPRHELERPVPAANWLRPSTGSAVDVHVGITGATASYAEQWALLSQGTESMRIAGADVEVLSPAARTVHLVLHGAQHGKTRPFGDLVQALERVPDETWREAAALAERLGATTAFAGGLRLHEDGAAMAKRLGLPDALSVELILREDQAPLALGLKWLTEIPGWRGKVRLVAAKLFPAPGSLLPPGRKRTPVTLAGAYLRNLWKMTRLALPAWRALRRARRRAGSGTPDSSPLEMDKPSQARQRGENPR